MYFSPNLCAPYSQEVIRVYYIKKEHGVIDIQNS